MAMLTPDGVAQTNLARDNARVGAAAGTGGEVTALMATEAVTAVVVVVAVETAEDATAATNREPAKTGTLQTWANTSPGNPVRMTAIVKTRTRRTEVRAGGLEHVPPPSSR